MKIESLIKDLFQSDTFQLIDMKKGLTNKNYKLVIHNKCYVVRIPYDDHDHIVTRTHEIQALRTITDLDLDVKTIYFNKETGVKITEFVEGAIEYKDCLSFDKIERTAVLMKKLHTAKLKVDAYFQPLERLQQYRSHITCPLYDLTAFDHIEHTLEGLSHNEILCHNDWVSGNILFTKDRDYLIDYEYAANNDPLFDVMSFLTENEITDKAERKRFYDVYFDEFSEDIQCKLDLWEDFHNLLWCNWAMMMYESRNDEVYREIANAKYNALKERVNV